MELRKSRSINRPIVVVTGGSRGIGRQLSRRLAAHGWDVAICSRSATQSGNAAAQLARDFGVRSLGVQADVASDTDMSAFAEHVNRELGKPSALICNAAILGPVGTINQTSAVEWASAHSVNVLGTVHAIRAFWEVISRQQDGRILCMSGGGIGGPNAMKRASAYTSSKSAIAALVESLSQDLNGSHATINMIAPGSVPTTFMDGLVAAGPARSGEAQYLEALSRKNNQAEDLPQPLIDLVFYLLSKASRHINGCLLSGRWDTPQGLNSLRDTPRRQNLYKLRRVDDTLFFE